MHVNAKLVYEALIVTETTEKLRAVVTMLYLPVHIRTVVANPKQKIAIYCAYRSADHLAFHCCLLGVG
jgi:hypothetical protein